MNIKTKLILGIGMLAGMIILLVTLSVVNLQLLTATEPDSPAAMPALERALLWISVTGGICILTGLTLLYWLPRTISKPIKELKQGILEIANHNYEERLDMRNNQEFREVAESFNRMAERLAEYRASTLADILSAKKFIEAIVNSIDDPIIGLNMDREILFINEEALNVLNLKRGNVIRKSAEELSLKNDLLRRLIRELVTPGDQKEPLKIYADDKESYFKASYIPIINTDAGKDEPSKLGDVILLKNITEFKELDSAKTTFISTISHELKTPIAAIMMSLQLLEDKRVGELNDEQEQLSKSIKENSERLLSITGELLNMTQVAQQLRGLDKLSLYTQKPSPTTILVICHKEKNADKRSAFYKGCAANGAVLESVRPRDYEIASWLQQFIAKKGLAIDAKALSMLTDHLGTDISKISNELGKLVVSLPEGTKRITDADIEANIGISKDFNNFELCKAVVTRDMASWR